VVGSSEGGAKELVEERLPEPELLSPTGRHKHSTAEIEWRNTATRPNGLQIASSETSV
jgi:hypothetical protein